MVYFEVKLGWTCYRTPETCPGYPENCADCFRDQLTKKGFTVEKVSLTEKFSKEKQMDTMQTEIWLKYTDLLNIKSLVVMDLNSGACVLNLPVSEEVDGTLLSGFIQANVMFSGGLTSGDQVDTVKSVQNGKQFYEFQYERFNILMLNGQMIRVALVLDNAPSDNLKSLLTRFVAELEAQYREELITFSTTGKVADFMNLQNITERIFEIHLLNPMVVPGSVEPTLVDGFDQMEKGVFEIGKGVVEEKGFFFVSNLIDRASELFGKDPKEILWAIYKLLKMKVFLPRSIEEISEMIDSNDIKAKGKKDLVQSYDLMSLTNQEILQVKDECKALSEKDAKERVEAFQRNGAFLEKTGMVEKARQEYEKALVVARMFNFNKLIGKLSFSIVEIVEKNKMMELNHALDSAKAAEKKKDYVTAIKFTQAAIDIYINLFDLERDDKRVLKLREKLDKLRALI
ncbi:MAG: hypothetical protein ACTSU5_03155 [Promethearchaeota archaeon]